MTAGAIAARPLQPDWTTIGRLSALHCNFHDCRLLPSEHEMPMYFFNLRENGHLIRDWAGCELYSDQEAIAAAQAHLRRAHARFSPGTGTSHFLEIWDRAGHLIATLPCEESEDIPSVDPRPLGNERARKTKKARRP